MPITPENGDEILPMHIIGAGMAGLSTGYHIQKQGFHDFRIFEASSQTGGLARSFKWHGIDCDLGPHRFFSTDQAITDELISLVECAEVKRKSKILINNKTIADPINIIELLWAFFPSKSYALISNFIFKKVQALWYVISRPIQRTSPAVPGNFNEFVEHNYGSALNQLFFKPYTEKLFGIDSSEISAEWGINKVRVNGLRDMIRGNTKLYFRKFYYPKSGGYGSFVSALTDSLGISHPAQPMPNHISKTASVDSAQSSPKIMLGYKLRHIHYDAATKVYSCDYQTSTGEITVKARELVATIPITKLMQALGHPFELDYRSVRFVYLHLNVAELSDCHWRYIIDSNCCVNRLSEFKQFAKQHSNTTVVCAEVTNQTNFSIEQVISQLEELGLLTAKQVLDHKVIKIQHAYPIYRKSSIEGLSNAQEVLKSYPSLHYVGRQAEFKHMDIDEVFGRSKRLVKDLRAC